MACGEHITIYFIIKTTIKSSTIVVKIIIIIKIIGKRETNTKEYNV